MVKINNWKIKEKILENSSLPDVLLKSLNGNLVNFSNFNQTVGAVCEVCSSRHIETFFQVYTNFGVFIAKNDMIDLNFKVKENEEPKPQSYLG